MHTCPKEVKAETMQLIHDRDEQLATADYNNDQNKKLNTNNAQNNLNEATKGMQTVAENPDQYYKSNARSNIYMMNPDS